MLIDIVVNRKTNYKFTSLQNWGKWCGIYNLKSFSICFRKVDVFMFFFQLVEDSSLWQEY